MRTYINLLATNTVLHEECIQSKQSLMLTITKLCKQLPKRVSMDGLFHIMNDRRLSQNLIDAVWRKNYGDREF